MNHEEMTRFILSSIIDGLMAGKPLARIAGDLAVSIATIAANNLRDAATKEPKP